MSGVLTTGQLRAIDADVAERVMGWKIVERGLSGRNHLIGSPPGSLKERVVPFYSTDVGAAWKVIERLMQDARHVSVHADHEGSACVVTLADGRDVDGHDDLGSPALAICLAALAVLGIAAEVTL